MNSENNKRLLPDAPYYNLYAKAVELSGKDFQVDIAIEEMSELTKALLKHRRACSGFNKSNINPEAARDDIYEEIADVIIALCQLIAIFGGTDEINNIIKTKIERFERRLGLR